nr:hypothetical protein BaRGS_005833 [Batillaria attramentaria]
MMMMATTTLLLLLLLLLMMMMVTTTTTTMMMMSYNPAEEVGLDWTHPQEASIQHHTSSPDMEPSGEKEDRPASQQLD